MLILQSFQTPVQTIKVPQNVAESFIHGIEALVDRLEAPVDRLEAPVDFGELPAQKAYQLLVFAIAHAKAGGQASRTQAAVVFLRDTTLPLSTTSSMKGLPAA